MRQVLYAAFDVAALSACLKNFPPPILPPLLRRKKQWDFGHKQDMQFFKGRDGIRSVQVVKLADSGDCLSCFGPGEVVFATQFGGGENAPIVWGFSQGRNILVSCDSQEPSKIVREFFWSGNGRRFVGDDNLGSGLRSFFGSLPPTLEIVEGAKDVPWVADFNNKDFNWGKSKLKIGQVMYVGARLISLEKAME